MSSSRPSLPAFTIPTRISDHLQPLRECGRLMGSDSHPRTLRHTPLNSKRIGYLYPSHALRQKKLRLCDARDLKLGEKSPYMLQGSVVRLIHPFQGFTGNRFFLSSRKLLRAPLRDIPGYSLLSGGRLLTGGRHCALICIPPARHCIICLSAFRSLLAHGTTGHWHRVSPMLFPNAGVPTAPTVESFRLSERFSSRLCTELQKRPGGTHYKYSIFNVENPGRTASRILRERCSLKTNKSYNSRISSALNLWFNICKSGNTKKQTCSAVSYSR